MFKELSLYNCSFNQFSTVLDGFEIVSLK